MITKNVPIQGSSNSYTMTWDSTEEPTFIFAYSSPDDPSPLYIEYVRDINGQLCPAMSYAGEEHPAPDPKKYILLSPQEVDVQRSLGTLPDEIISADNGEMSTLPLKVWVHK